MSGEPAQRLEAARAFAFIGPKASFAVTPLLDALKDPDADLRFEVTCALAGIESDEPSIVPAMQRLLGDSDPRVRAMAAVVLVKREKADAELVLPHLCTGLGLTEPAIILDWTIEGLRLLGPRAAPAVPNLVALFDNDLRVNYLAGHALAKIGAAAVPALIETLEADNPKVRNSVLLCLGEMGPEAVEALPVIRQYLSSGDALTRSYAKQAITKIEHE
jgi:HEAT repeat protein